MKDLKEQLALMRARIRAGSSHQKACVTKSMLPDQNEEVLVGGHITPNRLERAVQISETVVRVRR